MQALINDKEKDGQETVYRRKHDRLEDSRSKEEKCREREWRE